MVNLHSSRKLFLLLCSSVTGTFLGLHFFVPVPFFYCFGIVLAGHIFALPALFVYFLCTDYILEKTKSAFEGLLKFLAIGTSLGFISGFIEFGIPNYIEGLKWHTSRLIGSDVWQMIWFFSLCAFFTALFHWTLLSLYKNEKINWRHDRTARLILLGFFSVYAWLFFEI